MVQRDATSGGGYFTLMLFPPADLQDLPRQPLEMVFTIDVSGSQSGAPLAQEKAAIRYALTHMGPDDTFQVIRFGNTAQKLFDQPAARGSSTRAPSASVGECASTPTRARCWSTASTPRCCSRTMRAACDSSRS